MHKLKMAVRASRRVLAVSSGGGHWIQLQRIMPAFRDQRIAYVTTLQGYRSEIGDAPFYVVPDANRWNKFGLIRMALKLAWILIRERPDLVISTGAAPGFFAIRLGKALGATTVWVDSMANVEELSLSGMKAGPYADLWLTQWPHLARPHGPFFAGGVL